MRPADDYADMQNEAKASLDLSWHYEPGCPGTVAVVATIPSMPLPMGIVWIRFPGNHTIETLGSFVDSRVRRCGVRTAIHRFMLSTWPEVRKVITTSGTDYGLPWMKATGFRFRETTGDWEYVRRRSD